MWDERPSASYGIEEFYGLKPQAQMHTDPPIVFNTFSRMDDIRRAISVHQLGQKKEARSSSETLSLSPPIRGKLDVFFALPVHADKDAFFTSHPLYLRSSPGKRSVSKRIPYPSLYLPWRERY